MTQNTTAEDFYGTCLTATNKKGCYFQYHKEGSLNIFNF